MNPEPPLPNVSHIVSLESTNVKRLHAVRIDPKGQPLVIIGGANGAGKSSVLDSIAMALGGRGEMPAVPVRKGQKRAEIICDLGEIIVKRTLTKEGGGTLTVESADGVRFTSPQALLERLTGKIAFDPVSFMRLDAKRQADTLRQLVNLDFTAIDEERRKVYEERTAVNRDVDRLKGLHASLVASPDVPTAELSGADVLAEIKQANAANAKIEEMQRAVRDQRRNYSDAVRERDATLGTITQLEAELKRIQDELAGYRARVTERNAALETANAALEEAAKIADTQVRIDLAPLESKLAGVEETNRKVRQNQQKETARTQLRAKESSATALSQKIDDLDSKKQDTLAAVKFPVAGLGFNEDGVTFNELPLLQASGAQQLRISVAIAAAMNPKLRVMLIRDGSLLDEANLALLKDLATEFNLQIWVERVGKGAECSVIINDGEVEGAEPTTTEEPKDVT